MRAFRAILGGLLLFHAGAACAATASAPLAVSATVTPVCAVSSGFVNGRRGPARVDCAPSAAYAVRLDPRAADNAALRNAGGRASSDLAAPMERRGGVLVVEVVY